MVLFMTRSFLLSSPSAILISDFEDLHMNFFGIPPSIMLGRVSDLDFELSFLRVVVFLQCREACAGFGLAKEGAALSICSLETCWYISTPEAENSGDRVSVTLGDFSLTMPLSQFSTPTSLYEGCEVYSQLDCHCHSLCELTVTFCCGAFSLYFPSIES